MKSLRPSDVPVTQKAAVLGAKCQNYLPVEKVIILLPQLLESSKIILAKL